jgi:probable phosphoglycerate mutase
MIYIVRHAQTDGNRTRTAQGSGINSSLNATGWRQAHQLAAHYKNCGIRTFYCSALNRTKEQILSK